MCFFLRSLFFKKILSCWNYYILDIHILKALRSPTGRKLLNSGQPSEASTYLTIVPPFVPLRSLAVHCLGHGLARASLSEGTPGLLSLVTRFRPHRPSFCGLTTTLFIPALDILSAIPSTEKTLLQGPSCGPVPNSIHLENVSSARSSLMSCSKIAPSSQHAQPQDSVCSLLTVKWILPSLCMCMYVYYLLTAMEAPWE